MDIGKIRQLLKRYLYGSTNAGENDIVERWYNSFDREEPVVFPDAQKESGVKDEIWSKIEPEISGRTSVLSSIVSPWLKVAAVVVLVSCAGIFLVEKFSSGRSASLFSDISTVAGERKTVKIKDGSVLILNAGSHIRIGKDMSTSRAVEIVDGEVYFDVKKDAERPFIVRSGQMVTRVLGTSFNVTAYSALSSMNVQVTGGKVSVLIPGKKLRYLNKDEQLIFSKARGEINVHPFNPATISWTVGRLFLDDVSFDDMAVLMRKNFGIAVLAANEKLRNNRYTTELNTSMKAREVVEVLAAVHNLKIKKEGKDFLLYR